MTKLNINVKQLARDYRKGKTVKQLADKHGVSPRPIYSRLRAAGVKIRPKGKVAGTMEEFRKKWAKTIKMYRRTGSIYKVAEKEGVSPQAIQLRLISAGVERDGGVR